MLVRRGVEDVVGPVEAEHLVEALGVGDAAHERDHLDVGIGLGDFEVNEVQRALGPIQDHEAGRTIRRDLPAELGTDRAGAAGDQDRLAGEVLLHFVEIEQDRFAAEQIFDLHVA